MTTVLVAADKHYYRDANGRVYADAIFGYDFYKRYLTAFDHVFAVGRVTQVQIPPEGKKRADGPGVTFLDLAPGRGIKGYISTAIYNYKKIRQYIKEADCVIARVTGVVPNMVVEMCERQGVPYSIEVVVDPWLYFAPEVRSGLVFSISRRYFTSLLRKACMNAEGVSYVTERYLQERYPCRALRGAGGFTEHYSSVELPDEDFASPRIYRKSDCVTVAHVAHVFEGNSKGHYTLFKAIEEVLKRGYKIKAICVGDGPSKKDYLHYLESRGIEGSVEFVGVFADGSEVRKCIAKADAFVFPTKAEGLPRALLEAMAEGLPCLASSVCGIPEILQPECLFDPDDYMGFASGIISFIENPTLMSKLSQNNITIARKFSVSELAKRRTDFYRKVASTAGHHR